MTGKDSAGTILSVCLCLAVLSYTCMIFMQVFVCVDRVFRDTDMQIPVK